MQPGQDRRRYPRFAQNDVVRLTLLGDDGRFAQARIIDSSATGVRLESPIPLKSGSLVKVEWKDTMLLGEVLYSQGTGPLTLLGVELTRVLYGMSELRRLNSNLTGAIQADPIPTAR